MNESTPIGDKQNVVDQTLQQRRGISIVANLRLNGVNILVGDWNFDCRVIHLAAVEVDNID
jgi:hypothetical protein